ncbi:hypothetical protein PgNI_05842, partial [Pyricularia grisea]|uniref:Uncharacterized protein n=1 Tax=Pyricularia grisea TaxID=148305 RepID=A0A6P8B7I7_PYRGI
RKEKKKEKKPPSQTWFARGLWVRPALRMEIQLHNVTFEEIPKQLDKMMTGFRHRRLVS